MAEEEMDDEVVNEEFDESEEVEEDVAEEEEEESRPSRRSRRSKRSSRDDSRAREPKERKPKNYTVAFVLALVLGPLGADRFAFGEIGLGVVKLLGTIIGIVMLAGFVTAEQLGMESALMKGIGLFGLFGMLVPLQVHDIIFNLLQMTSVSKPYAIVYCSHCDEQMEIDLEQEDLKGIVCSYSDCRAQTPPPEKNIIEAVRDYFEGMIDHSLFAVGLFVGAALNFIAAFYILQPDVANGEQPQGVGPEQGMQVMLIGGFILVGLLIWQVMVAEKEKPICHIA